MPDNVIQLYPQGNGKHHQAHCHEEGHIHTEHCSHGDELHHHHAPKSLITACESVEHAVHLLLDGQLVALPTETVYGLAADALNEQAVAEVFELKGRPTHHPLIVHVGEGRGWQAWFDAVPPALKTLTDAFWPGPLTVVALKAGWVPTSITGGKPTVALRMPSHPLTLAVLNKLGAGVVAPSANAFGQLSPTSAEHVATGLNAQCNATKIPLSVLDGGTCEKGVESTLVAWREDLQCVQLLRPGSITKAMLETVLNAPVLWEPLYISEAEAETAPASGTLASHYAPQKPCFSGTLAQINQRLASESVTTAIAVLSFQVEPPMGQFQGLWHAMPSDASAYATQLYATLHLLDADETVAQIFIELPETTDDVWLAIADRLSRASVRL
ncbi:MAG: threonylcarbamoyl-AMP synthase [Vampirovibrio sp.]|nr:threonylcarbamoyl-AMP synthase [Vampirovibrio sp.]